MTQSSMSARALSVDRRPAERGALPRAGEGRGRTDDGAGG